MRAARHHPPASNYRCISVLAATVLFVSSSGSSAAQAPAACVPSFTPVPPTRRLVSDYLNQGLESLPFVYPTHTLLEEPRNSRAGQVEYSMLVYKKDRTVESATIEGAAAYGNRAWDFTATCPTAVVADSVATTIARIADLASRERGQCWSRVTPAHGSGACQQQRTRVLNVWRTSGNYEALVEIVDGVIARGAGTLRRDDVLDLLGTQRLDRDYPNSRRDGFLVWVSDRSGTTANRLVVQFDSRGIVRTFYWVSE